MKYGAADDRECGRERPQLVDRNGERILPVGDEVGQHPGFDRPETPGLAEQPRPAWV